MHQGLLSSLVLSSHVGRCLTCKVCLNNVLWHSTMDSDVALAALRPLSHLSVKCLHGASCALAGQAGYVLLISTYLNGSGSAGWLPLRLGGCGY